MRKTPYYSIRTGKNQKTEMDLTLLKRLFSMIYDNFTSEGYFQEAFGYVFLNNYFPGKAGRDIDGIILHKLRKESLWPIKVRLNHYTEDDLFDMTEFLYDHVSAPTGKRLTTGTFLSYSKPLGQKKFRLRINEIFSDYKNGYELNDKGEVVENFSNGLDILVEEKIKSDDPDNIDKRIEKAIEIYRSRHSDINVKKTAVLELGQVFEYIRKDVKKVLTSHDESDLFNILNKFALRHHNKEQKSEYDDEIFVPWLFTYYLSAINASLRLIKRTKPLTDA